jgi:hypothetical protein
LSVEEKDATIIAKKFASGAAHGDREKRLFASPHEDDGIFGAFTIKPSLRCSTSGSGVTIHMRTISPAMLGPVVHKQPDVPDAPVLENLALDRFIDYRSGKTLTLREMDTRTIFCCFYESLVRPAAEFARLRTMHVIERRSLLLVGPGARLIQCAVSLADVARFFSDENAPFGHEMVLFTMLAFDGADAEQSYPWRAAWRHLFGVTFTEYYA